MTKLFIFDVDDVICDLKFIIHKALHTELGIDIAHEKWFSFNLEKVYGVPMKEIFDAFHKHDILRNGKLNDEIYKTLDYLKNEKIDTMALTARGWHPEGNEITRVFFEENKINIPRIHVVNHSESKAKVISQLNDFEVVGFVDDNIKHIVDTKLECGDKVGNYFLRTQPWNMDFEKCNIVKRIDSLNDIPNHLDQYLNNTKKNKIKINRP